MAALGTDFLVAWQNIIDGANSEIQAVRFAADGTPKDATPIVVGPPTTTRAAYTTVSADGTNWLVTWRTPSDGNLWAGRVPPAPGAPLDGAGFQVSTGGAQTDRAAIAWNGTDYLVVWSNLANGGDISASRVTSAGVVLDAAAAAIPVASHTTTELRPSVASDGSGWLVTWNDGTDVYRRARRGQRQR